MTSSAGHEQWLGSGGTFFDEEDVQAASHLHSRGERVIPVAISLVQFESENMIS